MISYNDRMAARFLQATVGWGLFALVLGILAVLELQYWPGKARQAWLSFGRLSPIHAELMIYGFAGNALFAGIYYALQRLCQRRIWSDRLVQLHFWGWQALLLAVVITLALGLSQGRSWSEIEWPLDILLFLLWGLFGTNLFVTLRQRRPPFLYISLWFFIATVIGFALLHLVNALAWPAGPFKSYPLFVGVTDAMIQAWFVQGMQGLFLTLPFLGLMYYFVPRTVKKPLHSYRLAVLQFWALVAFILWTGPIRLLSSSLPEWMQSLGFVFSVILLAPSWGAVINGLYTIGRDPKFRRHPAVLFFGLSLLCLGAYAFLQALTSFKNIQLYLQFTEWMSAQSHLLMMGWIASFISGMAYYLVPMLWQHPLFSRTLGRWHFWISFLGLLLMLLAQGAGGIMQGFRWLSVHENGLLVHPEFLSTVEALKPHTSVRLIGAALFVLGSLLGLVNFYQTARRGQLLDSTQAPEEFTLPEPNNRWERWERQAGALSLGILIFLLLGTLLSLLPLPSSYTDLKPYSPLVQYGRDIYIREGCAQCHTQSVRVALREELRYGPASRIWEYQQDRPALWGQLRRGPDLLHIGGKYPNLWHYQHLIDPQAVAPGSTMPAYPWLLKRKIDVSKIKARHEALQKIGVAFGPDDPEALYRAEVQKIQESLTQAQIAVEADREILALIAYLQKLGTDDKR